jgi:hypothetical protein
MKERFESFKDSNLTTSYSLEMPGGTWNITFNQHRK